MSKKKKKKKAQKKQIKQTTIGLMDSLKFHTYHLSNLLVLHYINKKYIYIYICSLSWNHIHMLSGTKTQISI